MRGVVLGLAIGLTVLLSSVSAAQVVFTYSATDFHSYTLSSGGPVTIPVSTVVVLQGDGSPRVPVATRTFEFTFRPPQASEPQMLQADVAGDAVAVHVLRSDLDGNMEATVEIPVSAGMSPDLKIYWSTKDAGPMITLIHPTLRQEPLRSLLSPAGQRTSEGPKPCMVKVRHLACA